MLQKTNNTNSIYAKIESIIPVYNTFQTEHERPWFKKYSIYWIFMIVILVQLFAFSINLSLATDIMNSEFDEMAITIVDFDFRSFSNLDKRRRSISYVEIDEVFGNQYLKEKDKKKKIDIDAENATTDPRIAGAANPIISNATAPIDLNPEIMPMYTSVARSNGIEGSIILELIISEKGQVLRARPVGKPLGYGLEQKAVDCYKRKKFKPSMNKEKDPITVKIYQPVRFVLL